METLRNFIGGEWRPARTGKTTVRENPATGEPVAQVPRSGTDDLDAAVEAARKAFHGWRLTPAPRRGEILLRASRILEARKEEIARGLTREMGKVIAEARGDVQEAIDMTAYMAGEGRRQWGETTPSELPEKFMMTLRHPIGVVAAVTPWNFPVAIPSWKMAPALVLGNTIVFKPASDTPGCAARFVEALVEAGVPPGVVNLVFGPGGELGSRICSHPDVAMVAFTGSTDVGRSVAAACAPGLKRTLMEMGGKNGVIVMGDADLDLAVDGILWAAFGTTGQRCTAASRVIAHRPILKDLTDRLVARAKALRLGDGLDPATEVGPLVNRSQQERVHSYTAVGRGEGARLLCGGEPAREGALARGCFYRPTIFDQVRPGMRIAQEEIFGPTLSILAVDSFEEAVGVANGTPFGLSASIFTRDVNLAFRAMRDLENGLVYVNAGTTGSEVSTPFGGMKGTGNGHREAGRQALDTFSEWKSCFIDYSGRLQRAQIDTHAS